MGLFLSLLFLGQVHGFDVHAHRGGVSLSSPWHESTLPVFIESIKAHAQILEFDVHRLHDGQWVIYHNPMIDTNSCRSKSSQALPFEKSLHFWNSSQVKDLECHGSQKPWQYTSLAFLPEVLELLKTNAEVRLSIEIKYDDSPEWGYPAPTFLADSFYKEIHSEEKRIMVQSFSRDVLSRLRDLDSQLSLVYLYRGEPHFLSPVSLKLFGTRAEIPNWFLAKSFVNQKKITVFSPNFRVISIGTAAFMKHFTSEPRDYKIVPYTINDIKTVRKFIQKYKIDGVVTDDFGEIQRLFSPTGISD